MRAILRCYTAMEYVEFLRRKLERIHNSEWHFATWERRPALVARAGGRMRLYTGQDYDAAEYELVEGVWDHDHCEICNATISNDNYKDEIRDAYTNSKNWLCPACHQRVVVEKSNEAV
jgi:hypothetical protein